jgi:hypothetical protein
MAAERCPRLLGSLISLGNSGSFHSADQVTDFDSSKQSFLSVTGDLSFESVYRWCSRVSSMVPFWATV